MEFKNLTAKTNLKIKEIEEFKNKEEYLFYSRSWKFAFFFSIAFVIIPEMVSHINWVFFALPSIIALGIGPWVVALMNISLGILGLIKYRDYKVSILLLIATFIVFMPLFIFNGLI